MDLRLCTTTDKKVTTSFDIDLPFKLTLQDGIEKVLGLERSEGNQDPLRLLVFLRTSFQEWEGERVHLRTQKDLEAANPTQHVPRITAGMCRLLHEQHGKEVKEEEEEEEEEEAVAAEVRSWEQEEEEVEVGHQRRVESCTLTAATNSNRLLQTQTGMWKTRTLYI